MLATLKSTSESNTWDTRMLKSGGSLKTKMSEKIFPNMKLMSTSHTKALLYDYFAIAEIKEAHYDLRCLEDRGYIIENTI